MRKPFFLIAIFFFNLLTFVSFAFGQPTGGAPIAGGDQPQASPIMSFLPMIAVFFIFWLLVFRPQMKQTREKQELVKALKQGDEVVTSSGMLGRITGVTDKVVTVEIADDVKVKMLKSQIAQVVKQGQIPDAV